MSDISALVTNVVAAYLGNNTVSTNQVSDLIRRVHDAFVDLKGEPPLEEQRNVGSVSSGSLVPAVPIKKSVFREYIICLEDGKRLKMLKRHLNNSYGMTPEEYRRKWGLPSTYPMTAPAYAEQRSALAKESGLGHVHPTKNPLAKKAQARA